MAKEIYVKMELITPEKAASLLKLNTGNRPKKERAIASYARQMELGQWSKTAQTISISDENILIDGQNRLYAVIKSGKSIEFAIAYNVPQESFVNLDCGYGRTISDVFAVSNVPNYAAVAAIIKSYAGLKRNLIKTVFSGGVKNTFSGNAGFLMSRIEIQNFYNEHTLLLSKIATASLTNYKKIRLFAPSQIGGVMLYLIKEKMHNEDRVYNFFHQLHFNEFIENNSIPILRERIILGTMSHYKMTHELKYIFLVKCWNAYISGKTIKLYTYQSNETIPTFL